MKYLNEDGVKYLWSKSKENFISVKGAPPALRNAIYRGKNLGEKPTEAQLKSIANDSFDDMFIGDYWMTGDNFYRIAAFDYFWNTGYNAFTKSHVVIVPDRSVYKGNMSGAGNTNAGYYGTPMAQTVIPATDTLLVSKLGDILGTHSVYLINKAENGVATGGAWYDRKSELLTEMMVFGNKVSTSAEGTFNGYNYEAENIQLPLFRLAPWHIYADRARWWLRDISDSQSFLSVYPMGGRDSTKAIETGLGVRPYFCIVGD